MIYVVLEGKRAKTIREENPNKILIYLHKKIYKTSLPKSKTQHKIKIKSLIYLQSI